MQRIALIGAGGMLASAVRRRVPAGFEILPFDLPDFDLTERSQVAGLRQHAPDIILNCAAYTNVDGCEEQRELALRVNGEGPGLLAELAREIGAVLLHISTDFVFSGEQSRPYSEEDATGPLSVYGQSKLLGEERSRQTGLKRYFIVRTSWLYGLGGNNFVETMLRLGAEREELRVVADQRGTPTWTDDLADALFALLATERYGIYHYSNAGECSWHQFAQEIFARAKALAPGSLRVERVEPIPTEGYPLPAARPKYSVLSKAKIAQIAGVQVPDWQQSLAAYLKQRSEGG